MVKRVSYIVLFILCLVYVLQIQAQSSTQEPNWTFKTRGKIVESAAIADSTVYFGSKDGFVYALNTKSGEPQWTFQTGGPVISRPYIYRKKIYVLSNDGNLYALDQKNGHLLWIFTTGGEHRYQRSLDNDRLTDDIWDYYLSSPVASNGLIYVGSSDHQVYALDAGSGKLEWKFLTGDVVHATPVITDGHVYIGSFDGTFYALNARNGELIWKFDTIGDRYFPTGEVQRGATVSDGTVYFGSRDYNLYALDTRYGYGHWNYKEQGSWIIARPLLYDGNLYIGTSDSHAFYSMSARNGAVNWKINLPMRVYGSAVASDQMIYFGCFNGILYGVNKDTGEINWQFQTAGSRNNYSKVYDEEGKFRSDFKLYGSTMEETRASENTIQSLGSIMSTPVIHNKKIFFGSTDSTFYAVDLP